MLDSAPAVAATIAVTPSPASRPTATLVDAVRRAGDHGEHAADQCGRGAQTGPQTGLDGGEADAEGYEGGAGAARRRCGPQIPDRSRAQRGVEVGTPSWMGRRHGCGARGRRSGLDHRHARAVRPTPGCQPAPVDERGVPRLRALAPTLDALVRPGFDQVRRDAENRVSFAVGLPEPLADLRASAPAAGACFEIDRQAELIADQAAALAEQRADQRLVTDAYDRLHAGGRVAP